MQNQSFVWISSEFETAASCKTQSWHVWLMEQKVEDRFVRLKTCTRNTAFLLCFEEPKSKTDDPTKLFSLFLVLI